MKTPRVWFAVLAAILLLVVGAAAWRLSTGGSASAAGTRRIKDLGTWKGGALAMMEVRRSEKDILFFVRWESGERSVRLGGPWREIPLVKDVPTGDLVLVVGEPGRYNLQIWKAPEGPFTAKYVGTQRDIEDELGKLHPGAGR
jgi:hypothetical protein